jgi:Rad52/22 family double-strand break repair protein
MTRYPDLFTALAAPFRRDMILVRKHDQARYVTARAVATRLDEVLGPENWAPCYERWSDDAVLCRLSITLPNGTQLTKCDAGSYSKMAESNRHVDPGDDEKGGFSDALKRAAVLYGVARHLYESGSSVPVYATTAGYVHPHSAEPIATAIATTDGLPSPVSIPCPDERPRGGTRPAEPKPAAGSLGWVHGEPDAPASSSNNGTYGPSRNGHASGNVLTPGPGKVPTTGKQLFGWSKDQEQRCGLGLLKYLNGWAKLQDFPGRMIDWNADQASLAYEEACRKLQSLQTVGAAAS